MADLSQFRGKRALVCGIPRDGAKTQQAWLDATDKAMRGLGIVAARAPSATKRYWASGVVDDVRVYGADVVMVTFGCMFIRGVRLGAKRAGVPVLRVRRDGSIDVEESNGGLRSGG